jgi:hypothetical protein
MDVQQENHPQCQQDPFLSGACACVHMEYAVVYFAVLVGLETSEWRWMHTWEQEGSKSSRTGAMRRRRNGRQGSSSASSL